MPLGLVLQSIWKTDAGSHRDDILRSIATLTFRDIISRGVSVGASKC